MANIEEILIKAGVGKKPTYSHATLVKVAQTITDTITTSPCPSFSKHTEVRKGDIFRGSGINGKIRPFVIAKVVKDGVYAIPMTTNEDEYTLMPYTSRFMGQGYFCNYIMFVKIGHVKETLFSMLDSTRDLNKAIRLIKEKVKTDLK